MPHKRNPVLIGKRHWACPYGARLLALPAMENVALWHERDISHSSVERMIGPDATITLDFALTRLTPSSTSSLFIPPLCRKTSTNWAA